ncbi:MAG: tocopherol cyclase family protein [Candidatus Izemoplasmatales bacterium]|nr:tocopherol cyclase family protein [Candidatus Izemoplasmatales bacterium]
MLKGSLAKKGYDWWWHSFTARHNKTNEEKAFYIEYYITNPKLSPEKVVLGQANPENLPSYVMINVGTWGKDKKQVHQFYPVSEFKYDAKTNEFTVGECFYSESHIKGIVRATKAEANNKAYLTDEGHISWDLKVNKQIAYNVGYGANRFFRWLKAFEMFWHAEGIKALYSGEIIIDGEKYIATEDTSYGYQDKNWGKDFTSPWLWISSCNLYSKKLNKQLSNSAIELGGGTPKVFKIPIKRKILIGIYYEGEMIEFNFSKFWNKSNVSFNFSTDEENGLWFVKASNRKYNIDLELKCHLKDMLMINYESPDGYKRHNNLYNGGTGFGSLKIFSRDGNLIDDIIITHAGCEYGEYN